MIVQRLHRRDTYRGLEGTHSHEVHIDVDALVGYFVEYLCFFII